CDGRATKERDELAPSHSITSSARTSRVGGTSRPSALAVLRLMTSRKCVVSLKRLACDHLVGVGARSTFFSPGQWRPASRLRIVVALVGNVHGLRGSVIITENAAPGNLRCLIGYDLGQSGERFSSCRCGSSP